MSSETEKIINKINALFAKAESTNSTHEAEALAAKAQELLTKYAVTQAMLDEQEGRGTGDVREITLAHKSGGAGAQALASMAVTLAQINSCVVMYGPGRKTLIFKGFMRDLELVELMYTSLLTQLASSYARDRRSKPSHVHGLTWRTSYFEGFASRASRRLKEAYSTARDDSNEHGLVLLDDRLRKIMELTGSGRYGNRRANVRSRDGYTRGTSAGGRADLGQKRVAYTQRELA